MALFPWKKGGSEGKGGGNVGTGGPNDATAGGTDPGSTGDSSKLEFSPEKAERFFSVARNRHDVGSYDYAANMWLQGLRFDPNNVEAVKGYFTSVSGHVSSTGAKSPTKDLEAAVNGRTPVHRFLGLMLAWSFDTSSSDKAVRAGIASADLGLRDVAGYLLPSVLKLAMNQPRPRKDHLVKLMEAFEKIEVFDGAVVAGDAALKADPIDGKLAAHVKNLAAQSTMNRGGYSQTGKDGGFRSNIRDADKQRNLEESDRLIKSGNALDRAVDEQKAAFDAAPSDKPTIVRYVKALMERGTVDDESTAQNVLMKAYADTQEFRFRQTAGELRMKQGRRKLRELKAAADAAAGDPAARGAFLEAEKSQLNLELTEYETLVAAYPTDLKHKYELGLRYLAANRQTDAIGQLQLAKNDGKLKYQAMLKLGLAFISIDWLDEAVETLRQAVTEYPDPNDEMGMEMRYELAIALMKKGESSRDAASLEEAERLASAIAMQNITYKDIRDRRTAIKGLIQGLKG